MVLIVLFYFNLLKLMNQINYLNLILIFKFELLFVRFMQVSTASAAAAWLYIVCLLQYTLSVFGVGSTLGGASGRGSFGAPERRRRDVEP